MHLNQNIDRLECGVKAANPYSMRAPIINRMLNKTPKSMLSLLIDLVSDFDLASDLGH